MAVNHFDAQIYIPQYLLTANGDYAKRPMIKGISNNTIAFPPGDDLMITATVFLGDDLMITTDVEVVSASLVRYGGVTHSLNNDQRRIPLHIEVSGTLRKYNTSIPSDGGVAIPGYYMLFVMNSKGVPSKAMNVQILVAEEYEDY